MELPSKELLSEVLGMAIIQVDHYDNDENELPYWYDSGSSDCFGKVNIYELAHKCKEWAVILGYGLSSYPTKVYKEEKILHWTCQKYYFGFPSGFVTAGSEPEAIFKACQWILDNKDK